MTSTVESQGVLHRATMPYGKGAGFPISNVLTNSDESVFYCAEPGCDYTAPKFSSVFAHSGVHAGGARGRKRVHNQHGLANLKRRIGDMLQDIETLEREIDSLKHDEPYRERALRAERELAQIRRAFSRLGLTQTPGE